MKKSIFLIVVAVAALLMSSCTKESIVTMSDSERISQIRNEISLNPDKFTPPTQEEGISAYLEAGGKKLKNGMADPKIGYCIPLNDIILLQEGMFQRIWVWSIINNDWLIDKGISVITYDAGYNQVGSFDFYIGWNNQFCERVDISSNAKGDNEIKLTLSYKVMEGQFSFDAFVFDEREPAIYLPQLFFNCAWEVQGNGTIFGGTLPQFNPFYQKQLILTSGLELNSNIKYYVKFPTQAETMPNSVMTVWVWDENKEGIKSTIIYPEGNILPESVMIGESFKPQKVSYQSKTYKNGMAVFGEYIEKDLFKVSEGVYTF